MGFADVTRTDAVFPASRPTVLQPSNPAASSFVVRYSRIFSPLSLFSFDDHDHQAKVVDDVHDYDDDDDDDKYEEQEEDDDDDDDVNGRGDGRVGGKGVAERRDGEKGAAAALVGGGCKILQPRGTHRDVISTTEPETYYNPAVLQLPSHSVSRA